MSYEKWSTGYWLLKQYIKLIDWMIHKRIIIKGRENIPENKPLIFAPNHQNALSDPLAVLLNIHQQPVWLARADIFGKSKVIDTILRFLKIMPVFRIRDGIGNLDKNEKTFTTSVNVLKNNAPLALFPEAAHTGRRQIISHKKAVPRIAFMAEDATNGELDIHIIPTGIYYSHYWKFDRTLIVNFGKPIKVQDFMSQHQTDPQGAIRKLKDAIYAATLPLILNFKTANYYSDFEHIRQIYGSHFLKNRGKKQTTYEQYLSDRELATHLDQLEKTEPEVTKEIVTKTDHYYSILKKEKLKTFILQDHHLKSNLVWEMIKLLITFPVFVYGSVYNAVPFFLIDRVVRKYIKDRTFWSSVTLVAAIIIFPVFYLIELWLTSSLLPGFWSKTIFIVSLILTGKIAFRWYIWLRKMMGRIRLLNIKHFRPVLYNDLMQQKSQLFDQLDDALNTTDTKKES
jgi:1-acyl-sn-glycerol-3-phosphate acyltransferase